MSTPNDYSADEWQAITAAPVAAGLAVVHPDGTGPMFEASDGRAIERAIARSTIGDAPEIVKVVASSVSVCTGCCELFAVPAAERPQTKERLIAVVRTAVRAVEQRSPAEVEPFKTWIASVAARVFHAADAAGPSRGRGGSFTRSERHAIDRLADVLRARPAPSHSPKGR
jgi:hypothetical protein